RVDVIAAVLRVIFEEEDGGVIPVRRVRDGFDEAANGEVIVGDGGFGRGAAGPGAGGVIVGEAQGDVAGHGVRAGGAVADPAVEVAEEDVHADLVGHPDVEVGSFGREM